MSHKLAKDVLVGGVIYPAGREVPDDVAEQISADVWDTAPATTQAKPATKAPAKKQSPRAKTSD